MFGVHGAAKKLDTVIQIVVHLDKVDDGFVTHTLERDAVQLVFRIDVGSGITNADIPQHTGVVVGVGTAEATGIRFPFLGALRRTPFDTFRAVVDGRPAIDDQTTPEPAIRGFHVASQFRCRSEHDGLNGGAVCNDGAALFNDQEVGRAATHNYRTGGHPQLAGRKRLCTDVATCATELLVRA